MGVDRRLYGSGDLLLQNVVHCAEDCALCQAGYGRITPGTRTSPDRRQNIVDIFLDLVGIDSTAGSSWNLLLPYRFLRYGCLRGELNAFATAQSRSTGSGQRRHFGLLNLDAAFAAFADPRSTYFRCIALLFRNGFLLLQALLRLRLQQR